ncbi:MAG: DUF433 domain-containing protein [Planctomycetaceae bacterium]
MGSQTERGECALLERITSDPSILGGKPCIRGTRISVELILEWVASGASRDDIMQRHPQLTVEDVEQALVYAANSIKNEVLLTAEVPM